MYCPWQSVQFYRESASPNHKLRMIWWYSWRNESSWPAIQFFLRNLNFFLRKMWFGSVTVAVVASLTWFEWNFALWLLPSRHFRWLFSIPSSHSPKVKGSVVENPAKPFRPARATYLERGRRHIPRMCRGSWECDCREFLLRFAFPVGKENSILLMH